MTTQYPITANEWTAITVAGENASCWLDEDSDGAGGKVDVRLAHSTEGIPNDQPSVCKRLYKPCGNDDTTTINADNARDIWYARCLNSGDTARVSVDHGLNNLHEIDVNIQSQINQIVQFFLMSEDKSDIGLTSPAAKDAVTLAMTSGHGFTTGSTGYEDWIAIWENGNFDQSQVISVAGDNIGIRVPLARAYTTAAVIVRGKINMSVDGSVTPKKFYFRPRQSTVPFDISTEMVIMAHSADTDDGKFGGVAALTNGMLYRRVNGYTENLGNYRMNQSFRDRGWDVSYPTKAPSGTFATECRMRRIEVHTQETRLDPRTGDYFEVTIRDAVNAGGTNTRLVLSALGSYTEGE